MKHVANALRVLLVILGVLCIVSVVFSITARDQWWIRAFDYPRIQLAILSTVVLFIAFALFEWQKLWTKIFLALLAVGVLVQGYILYPYFLPVAPQVPDRELTAPERSFSLLVSNVLMENEEMDAYLELVEEHDPDVILVMEANERWTEHLAPLRETHEHYVEQPQDNHYGMNLYSRFPLDDTQIHYLEDTNTPAIETVLQLPSGDEVGFIGSHPRPPLPDNSVQAADRELLVLAERTKEAERPTVVAGDFNDVPWSYTTEKFQEISKLRDIRVGRGFYNTFDAKSAIVRAPIDHVFITPGLGLVDLNDPLEYSSDHFALFVRLMVDETAQ